MDDINDFAHHLLRTHIERGQITVDATAGNGHDTCFLAELVGETGHVYAFDVQPEAIRRTADRLARKGHSSRVTLIEAGHERVALELAARHDGVGETADPRRIRAATFNLGYRPGGDKSIITTPETTIAGLESVRQMLEPGGLLTVVVYSGHEGGAMERDVVLEWAASLPISAYAVIHYRVLNAAAAPELVAVQRRA